MGIVSSGKGPRLARVSECICYRDYSAIQRLPSNNPLKKHLISSYLRNTQSHSRAFVSSLPQVPDFPPHLPCHFRSKHWIHRTICNNQKEVWNSLGKQDVSWQHRLLNYGAKEQKCTFWTVWTHTFWTKHCKISTASHIISNHARKAWLCSLEESCFDSQESCSWWITC